MTTPSERLTPRFPGLDTLRAVASIAVVGTHTSFWAGYYGNGTLGAATQRLEVGVAIFFVLSGFLLGFPYVAAARTGQSHDSIGRYFWKRALRILPVYWVVVVAAFVLLPDNRSEPAHRWITNLLLVDLYTSDALPHGLTQMWSLTTEASFYLVLPALMWFLLRVVARRRWRPDRLLLALAASGLVSLLWAGIATPYFDDFDGWANRWLVSYLIWFAAGIALAVVTVDLRAGTSRLTRPVVVLAASPSTCWTAAIALYAIASTPLAGPAGLFLLAPHESVMRTLLYTGVAVLVVLPSVFGDPTSTYARILALPALRHLGHISYSLFCCHIIVLELVSDWTGYELFRGHGIELFALTLGISLVVSELLYRFVEMPFLRLKDARPPTRRSSSEPSANATSSAGTDRSPAQPEGPAQGSTTK
ncbi:acyltransferase family protein [Aeromicrobium stalagmiti]|uniref:acyltransferase family protein n=1 Tax=Aeromicrobium stalagmiti TaxID=2738988 RepID=UPI0020C3CB97|nr:acyltransferase [Aeromicrobium stalagmiti]